MIRSLTGTITETTTDAVILTVSGVGYRIFTTPPARLSPVGTETTFHTYLSVRETALDLYGFLDTQTLELFEVLITIPKIGPRSALQILEHADTTTLLAAAKAGDPAVLTKLAGIGKKTAERIALGLHEKIELLEHMEAHDSAPIETEALDTLIALGYPLSDARAALKDIDPQLSLNEQVKLALQRL